MSASSDASSCESIHSTRPARPAACDRPRWRARARTRATTSEGTSDASVAERDDLVADAGVVAVAGVHDGLGRQREQARADRLDDRVEVRERAPVAPGPPLNSVSPEKTRVFAASWRLTPPGEWPGRVQRDELDAAGVERARRRRSCRRARASGGRRPRACGRRGGSRSARRTRVGELDRRVDVVVVAVGADDRDHPPAADAVDDRRGLVRGVDHEALVVVADDPDVVVDLEVLAVDREGPVGDDAVEARGRRSQHHHRAQHLAALHLVERLLDRVERDRLGHELVERRADPGGRGR